MEPEWVRIQEQRFDAVVLNNCVYVPDILSSRIAHVFCNHCKGHLVACCKDRHYYGACEDPCKCNFEKELNRDDDSR